MSACARRERWLRSFRVGCLVLAVMFAFVVPDVSGRTSATPPAGEGGSCAGAADWWVTTETGRDEAATIYRRNAAAWVVGQVGPDSLGAARARITALRATQAAAVVPPAGLELHRFTLDFFDAVLALIDLVGVDGDPASVHAARLTLVENIAPMMLARTGERSFLTTCHPVVALVRTDDGAMHAVLPGEAGPGAPAVACAEFSTRRTPSDSSTRPPRTIRTASIRMAMALPAKGRDGATKQGAPGSGAPCFVRSAACCPTR
ncbi:MAG: hypothetical protein QM753_16910 [Thermomicrobiales bacterium]